MDLRERVRHTTQSWRRRADEWSGGRGSEQLTVIEPPRGWLDLDLREMWIYRELLYFLAWRDVKVLYKQTVLGFAWAIIRPVVAMVIFSIIFGRLAGIPSEDAPYPLFVFAGLLPWQFFSTAVTGAAQSLVANRNLLTKIYFPRLFLPTSAVGTPLVDLIASFMIYAALMLYYRHMPGIWMLLVPVLIVLTMIASMGAGYILASLTVIYRDFVAVVPFLLQAWMYASPVVYPVGLFPERYQWIVALNPMAGIIDTFRAAMLNRALDWQQLGISSAVAVVSFIIGIVVFRRMERRFADIA